MKNWYRCARHKVIYTAMSPAEARQGTGRAPDHCGSNQTWWIADERNGYPGDILQNWLDRGYRNEAS